MVLIGPLVGGAFSVINGIVFSLVGRALSKRTLSGEDARANTMFMVWWYSLGSVSIIGGGFSFATAFGLTDLALHITLTYVAIFAICIGFWGLGYYLAYLFTGNKGWLMPLGLFYGFFYVLVVYLIIVSEPIAVTPTMWGTELEYRNDLAERPYIGLVGLVWLAPPIIGALAYLSLVFRVRSSVQRFRIAMVAGSVVLWFGSSIVASTLNLPQTTDWWMPVSQLISFLAALAILTAYRTPARIQRILDERDRLKQAGEEPA